MIEKFSDEELDTLIQELKAKGLNISKNSKGWVMNEIATSIFGGNPYIPQTIKKGIYSIADYVTNNYEKKYPKNDGITRTFARIDIPPEIEKEYRRIIKEIFETLKPYYGTFIREKNQY